jgi:hypothetical protein
MLVKKVNEKTLDVFVGKGWTGWSRFEAAFNHGKLLLRLVKGSPMRKEDFKQLYEELNK